MAAVARANNKRMYSWWWDSHISPKNSKWLQENLTDMDAKVKQMIKLLEEDADSFARRAEMYYKKRPELMKLVEEFYRAYRALAERYDHATGALRQAQKTMAEAFPNQIPLMPSDDSDPRTPETQMPFRMPFDSEEFNKDSLESSASDVRAHRRHGAFTEESDSATGRRGLKQFSDIFGNVDGRARRGLSFQDVDEKEVAQTSGSKDPKSQKHPEAERNGESDMEEIINLKKALAKLEAEKETDLLQYQQSMEKFTNMEREFSQMQEDSKQLNERAKQAEAEVQSLKEALEKFEAEKEANLLKYQECLDKISDLENSVSRAEREAAEVNERSSKAESEAETLKDELAMVQAEKEVAYAQYKNFLETISNLEDKLRHAENNAQKHSERADKAEAEVAKLKEELAKLTEEKEAAAGQLLQCLETISDLECRITSAEEEAQRLNFEIQSGVEKLRGAEEKCLLLEQSNESLHSELESLAQKVGTQNAELLEKQQELGRLWTCIQEERLRFVEAETAFQTLQHLHSQSQEELRSLAAQLQTRNQMLSDIEAHNQGLQAEVHKIAEDNKNLNELNLTSSMTIKSLQEEIITLREKIQKLKQEIELRVNERNALQQEIYCLKEELNDLNKKHCLFLEQVNSVGLDPESFGSSVKELQDEKLKLQELHEQDINEKAVLMEKLAVMDKLVEKNVLLENSLSDLNVELEGVREKVKVLEESCESLLEEKSGLVTEKDSLNSQLHIMTENFDKLTEQNKILENSLSDTNTELEELRIKLKGLEESCLLLGSEKSSLITERESLVLQLGSCQEMLKDLEGRHELLEQKHSSVEKERDLFSLEVTKFKDTLDAHIQEHASFAELSGAQIADKESQLLLLQQEFQSLNRDYREEWDKNLSSHIEMLILLECFRDLEGRSFSLFLNCQKLERTLRSSGEEISTLTTVNLEQQEGLKSLSERVDAMQIGLFQLLRIFEKDGKSEYTDNVKKDRSTCDYILKKVQTLQRSLSDTEDKLDLVNIEKLVLHILLEQAELDAANFATERNSLKLGRRIQQGQILALQNEVQHAISMSDELSLELLERLCKEEVLKITLEFSHVKIRQMQEALRISQEENCMVVEKKKYLTSEVTSLREIKENLEEENDLILGESFSKCIMTLVLEDAVSQKISELRESTQDAISMSDELSLELLERLCKEEVLKITLEFSRVKIRQMQEALRISQEENCMVVEKKKYLTSEVTSLREIKENLEEENDLILGESFSKCVMTLVLEDAVSQKISELRESTQEVRELHFLVSELEGKLKMMEENFANEQIDKSQLEGSLEKLENELKSATSVNNQLNLDLAGGKDLLSQTEMKLLEAENMLTAFETQKKELYNELDGLKGDHAELKKKEGEQREEIHKLSEELDHQGKQVEILSNEKQQMEARLSKALEKIREYEVKEQSLNNELLKLRNETALWETQAATIFGMLLSSNFCELLLEDKFHELDELCKSLSESMTAVTQQLEKKVCTLEKENGGLMSKLSAYMSAVVSLTDCVASLEKKDGSRKELLEANNQGIKDDKLMTSNPATCNLPNGYSDSAVLDGISAMEDLQRRIKVIEERLLESLDTSRHGAVKHEANELNLQKLRVQTTEEMTKDIMLDQISEGSSYGLSRRETIEVDDQMLELWETGDQDGGMEEKVGKSRKAAGVATKSHDKEPRKDRRSLNPSAESLKELSVDRLESSESFSDPHQEGNKRKVLERLDSDAQKLTNLQITVEDLKRKVQVTEKNKKNGKGIEYDSVKEQLEESDLAIRKLYDANRKLLKTIQDGYSSSEVKSTRDSEDGGSISRRRVSEQARRGSEKIGRLQLELQKIQFLLLKLDDDKEAKGWAKTTERKTRVLLRDYLYGGMRNHQKRKKAHFCSCMQPPTKGD